MSIDKSYPQVHYIIREDHDMSIWETHDLSQWDPLAIKAVTPDGNLFGRHKRQGEQREEEDSNDKNKEEDSNEFSLLLNDETVLFENNDEMEKPPLLMNFPLSIQAIEEESEDVVKRVWLEALGLALFKVSGIPSTVPSQLIFPNTSNQFLEALKIKGLRISNGTVFPWVLTFPGGSLFSERIL